MTFWIAVYAVGAVQAAMLATALWRRAANPQANRVLAAWLALIAVDLAIKSAYLAAPDTAELEGAWRATTLLPSLYASLFYLYVRALTSGRGLAPRDVVHAGAFLAVAGWMGWRWASGASLADDAAWSVAWFDPVLFAWAAAYLAAALLRIRRYRQRLLQRRADADRLSLRWLVVLAACQLVIWAIALAQSTLRLPHIDYYLLYGAVAAWVCLVGWSSLAQPPVVELPEADDVVAQPGSEAQPGAGFADDPRYPEVEARLSRLMAEDTLYREPALAIGKLARRSGYPEYLVSAVINRRLGGNFWEYVNRHRIEAARERLADPGDARTVLDIAYDCGFTSKSTFNASFKRIVGETPSAFRQRHAAAGRRSPG